MEKALWSVARAVEGLASGQAAITKELAKIRKSTLRSEEHFELITDNVKSLADSMEMFTRGDRYLRIREMGKLEVPEVQSMPFGRPGEDLRVLSSREKSRKENQRWNREWNWKWFQ